VELAAARFRVGGYEFREPDYKQISIWAKALEIDQETLVTRLHQTSFKAQLHFRDVAKAIAFTVEEGSIISIVGISQHSQ
jgi:hypothetical protein